MNDTRTASILQRVPAILAVTAGSYGLSLQPQRTRRPEAHGERRRHAGRKVNDKPAAHA